MKKREECRFFMLFGQRWVSKAKKWIMAPCWVLRYEEAINSTLATGIFLRKRSARAGTYWESVVRMPRVVLPRVTQVM